MNADHTTVTWRWIEVNYCSPSHSSSSTTYASGSHRLREDSLSRWLNDMLENGKPVLITGIRTIRE